MVFTSKPSRAHLVSSSPWCISFVVYLHRISFKSVKYRNELLCEQALRYFQIRARDDSKYLNLQKRKPERDKKKILENMIGSWVEEEGGLGSGKGLYHHQWLIEKSYHTFLASMDQPRSTQVSSIASVMYAGG